MLQLGLLQKSRASGLACFVLISIIFANPALPLASEADDFSKTKKQAEKLKRKGDYEQAEKLFRYLLELRPQDSDLKLKLAYVLMKKQRLVEAYDYAYPVAKEEPKNSLAFAVLGMILLGAGNFKDASICFINSLNLNRKEDLAWAGLGLLDFYENRLQESLGKLEEAHFLEPDEPDYLFSMAQVSARLELYKQAANYYQKFLEIAPPTDVDRRERIKGLMKFLRYVGDQGKLYSLSGADRTSVTMKLMRDRPAIPVYIGKHKEPFNFVLDTGSGISVISERTAERLGIKPIARGGKARGIGGDGKFEIIYGFLSSIKIGDIKIENVPVYIRKFHSSQENVDGYIGLSVISKFLATIDYGSLQFTLIRRDDKRAFDFTPAAKTKFFKLRLTPSGYLSGEVFIDGVESPLNFIVDTGASISVISDELASLEPIRQFASEEKLVVIGAAGIAEDVPSYILPKITFAEQTRENLKAIVLNLDVINETAGFYQAGILGSNFLKHYRLTFDFVASKVYLEPIYDGASAKR
ncbi:MAG: aspartyl protease family protein [Pyrinomonadaceae bacterium]|nr:aspartyl protease family protein [Pyrinomonadaceae bacterium]MCX7640751.1 aspartyl protease family protein [Pyrinomonadaceae bacterium]MDW8304646.1 aspartyl protease family protein [Acidobacteriota bacterium]